MKENFDDPIPHPFVCLVTQDQKYKTSFDVKLMMNLNQDKAKIVSLASHFNKNKLETNYSNFENKMAHPIFLYTFLGKA